MQSRPPQSSVASAHLWFDDCWLSVDLLSVSLLVQRGQNAPGAALGPVAAGPTHQGRGRPRQRLVGVGGVFMCCKRGGQLFGRTMRFQGPEGRCGEECHKATAPANATSAAPAAHSRGRRRGSNTDWALTLSCRTKGHPPTHPPALLSHHYDTTRTLRDAAPATPWRPRRPC